VGSLDEPRKKTYEELYKRAIKVGRAKGLGDESEDFAGWIALKWLEGHAQHQTLDQSFIDYRRSQHGDARHPGGRARILGQSNTLSIAPAEGAEDGSSIAEDRLAGSAGELPPDRIDDVDPSVFLSGRHLAVYVLAVQRELSLREVGEIMGSSELKTANE